MINPRSVVRAFTLVELLVVIVVVGALAAIALPIYSSARAKAGMAGCTSNLKQFGSAMMLYAADHNNTLPPARDKPDEIPWPICYWNYAVNPYLARQNTNSFQTQKELMYDGVNRDPGKTDWKLDGTNAQCVSYAMNSFNTSDVNGVAMRLTNIEKPASTLLICDTAAGYPVMTNSGYMYGTPSLRHFGQDNVLFCDGHVQAVPKNGFAWNLVLNSANP